MADLLVGFVLALPSWLALDGLIVASVAAWAKHRRA